jgi:type IX secretion system substrate protein
LNKLYILGIFVAACLLASYAGIAQPSEPTYRTFSQTEFASKKENKVGKAEATRAWFTFHNDSDYAVNSLHVKFNGHVVDVEDMGGFTTVTPGEKQSISFTGRTVAAHDSAALRFLFKKGEPNAKADRWWWDVSGTRVGPVYRDLNATSTLVLRKQPGGGNVFEFLYKHEVRRPQGIVFGMKTDTPGVGWIRYKTADRKYLPHTDSSRCFDFIKTGETGQHPFVGELKNPHVKKHNNHLLGEVHVLMLAVIANDSGVTSPFDAGATRLGDLIYNDAGNPSDPSNSLTIRQIIALADSGLTYCGHFTAPFYFAIDSSISRINRAFDGPIVAISFDPLRIDGTAPLPPFLHPNPLAPPVQPPLSRYSVLDNTPEQFAMRQNYPNPFNPTTTIEFNLAQPSIVTLKVYNVLGQEVSTLLNRESLDEGEQSFQFDAGNLPSGVYFYRIQAVGSAQNDQQFQATRRMVLIK